MQAPQLTIYALPGRYAVSQLAGDAPIPEWASAAQGFVSITRRQGELSLVASQECVPEGVRSQGGWRLMELAGPFDFALTGILLSVLRPLAEAGVGIFALSTYDTDAVMVQEAHWERAVEALLAAGHTVV